MSFISKVFETEEIIEVRQVTVRKYKINWKRLFSNFLSILMFWKKKQKSEPKTKTISIIDLDKVLLAKSKEELVDILKKHSVELPSVKKQDSENTFKFSKDLVKWTVENSPVKKGFADGSLAENAVDGLKIHENMKANKK